MTDLAPALRAQQPSQSRRVTRADILALAPRPWEYLPLALAGLRQAPTDHELRLHAALALVRIGLVAPARELLGFLPPEIRSLPQVASVVRSIPAGDPSRIPQETLIGTARANIGAILSNPERVHACRPEEIRAAFDTWHASAHTLEWHRAAGGNIIRRTPGSWLPDQWRGLNDSRAAASRFAEQNLRFTSGQMPGPFTVEGVDPPWVLERLLAATAPTKAGGHVYRPRVSITQADLLELFDGLAQADLSDLLADSRVELFAGPNAAGSLAGAIASRRNSINAGPCIVTSGIRTRTEPPTDDVMEQARATRQAEIQAAIERVNAIYAARDPSWWLKRYRDAISGDAEPLRVLIPTCRYSTFVRHASNDLARAFTRAGMKAELLMEPDASSRLSATAYLDAIASLRPDLVVLINYTRAQISPHLTPHLPWATWIQDGMPHLFSGALAAGLGAMDVIVGHVFGEMTRKFGIAPERCMPIPVVADPTKFHNGPIDMAAMRRFGCDVAYVSHQSETPDAMHARLVGEGSIAPAALPMLDRIRQEVASIVATGLDGDPSGMQKKICGAVRRILRVTRNDEPEPELLSVLTRVYALPLAERIMRHQALEWTAAICRRRAWSFRLYGNGWDHHPTLASFAAGPLEHGDELRASYQAAHCHLHVSLTAPVHQRVMECALSGGLPVVRLHPDGLASTYIRACMAAARRQTPHRVDPSGHGDERWMGWDTIDHPELAAWASLRQRLGLSAADAVYARPSWLENLAHLDLTLPAELDPAELLVDPADVAFWDEATLERTLEHAITDDRWRRGRSDAIAARVRRSLTHNAFVHRLTRFVIDRLAAVAGDSVRLPEDHDSALAA